MTLVEALQRIGDSVGDMNGAHGVVINPDR